MTFFSEMAQIGKEMLTEFGQDAVFSYVTGESYDPVLMTTTGGVSGQVTSKSYPEDYSQSEVSDTILSSDRKLVCEKTTPIPAAGWTCLFGGENYRVMNTKSEGLDGDESIHYVQLRK